MIYDYAFVKKPNAQQAQFVKMTQTPIPRLIAGLAVPTIISMLVTAVYNMADTFFVAQLGTSAAGAVGIVFSLMAVIQAIGFMLGMGAGNLVSRYLGAKEQRQADYAASTAFFTALAFGLGITVLGTLFLDPLMRVLGATPTILPYARDYARYILFGAPVMCASFVLNNILRGEGKAMLAMVGCGRFASVQEAADALVETASTTEPDPILKEKYEKRYRQFRLLYPALKTTFARLAKEEV